MLHLQATFDRLINLGDLMWRSDEEAKTFHRLNIVDLTFKLF